MAFCSECGAEIEKGFDFCPSCGNEISEKEEEDATSAINVLTNITQTFGLGVVGLVSLIFLAGMISGFLGPDNQTVSEEKYNRLLTNYNELRNASMELEDIVKEYQEIPSTPAYSGLEYSLYGGPSGKADQIAFSHPNISVSGVAATGSMSPGISSQSMILETSAFNPHTLTPGQIVVYTSSEGDYIIHRIHSVNATGGFCYEMKGDANFYSDPDCVEPRQIEQLVLGVIFRQPGSKWYCTSELQGGPETEYCPS